MSEAKYNFIYEIKNLVNGKVYIGAHSTNNINDCYMGSGKAIGHALKKYGSGSFVRNILLFCKTSEDMYKAEEQIVNEEFVLREDTYNITVGGKGFCYGHTTPDEIRTKIANSLKGRPGKKHTDKSKEKMSQALKGKVTWAKGRHFSEEHKRRISDSQKGKPRPNIVTEETKEKISKAVKGRKRTDAEKLAISVAKKGKSNGREGFHFSEASKEKLRQAHLGKKLSAEHRMKLSIAHRRP